MPACRAKAAPTTRRRIARRFEEMRKASARIRTMPAIPINIRLTSPISPPSPNHLRLCRGDRVVEPVDQFADLSPDEQLVAPGLRHEPAHRGRIEEIDQAVPEAG